MSGILKVDQILLRDGSTASAADLGLNVAGTVVNKQSYSLGNFASTTTSYNSLTSFDYTPKKVGNIIQLEFVGVFSQNPSGGAGVMMKFQVDGVDYDVPGNGGELVMYTSTAFDHYIGGIFRKEFTTTAASHNINLMVSGMGNQGTYGYVIGSGWSHNKVYITEIAQ